MREKLERENYEFAITSTARTAKGFIYYINGKKHTTSDEVTSLIVNTPDFSQLSWTGKASRIIGALLCIVLPLIRDRK